MSYAMVRGNGLGAVSTNVTNNDFVKLMVDASNAVKTTADVVKNLTPPALQQMLTLNASIEAATGTDTGSVLSSFASSALIKLFPQLKEAFDSISTELFGPGGNYAWIGEELGAAVPLIGTAISIFTAASDPAQQAWGLPCHSGNPDYRAQGCRMLYRSPIGSGPNGMLMPADIFESSWDGVGQPPSPTTSTFQIIDGAYNDVGQSFINSFEGGYGCEDINSIELCALGSKIVNTPEGVFSMPKGFKIPMDTWVVIRKLRRAIQASYNQGDGGSALWPIYLDIVNYQWRNRVTGVGVIPGAWETNMMHAWWCKEMDPGETCFSHDTRGFDQMVAMLNGWEQTVHSPYSQYALPQLTEAQMVAMAKAALGKGVVSNAALSKGLTLLTRPSKKTVNLTKVNPALIQSIQLRPKTNPYLIAGGAAAAAGLLWWLFL